MKTLFYFAAALLAALLPCSLHANAGILDGSGASLRLGQTDKIQMVSEVVEITFIPADGPVTGDLKHRDRAHFRCRFILKNLSEETVTAQVGFPLVNQTRMPSSKEDPAVQQRALEHYRFEAKSGDTAYTIRYVPNDTRRHYSNLFVWDMEFKPDATLELEVSYSIYGYTGIGSTEKSPIDYNRMYRKPYLQGLQECMVQAYPYVTHTAGSWAGEVESAEFIIRYGDFEAYLRKRGFIERDQSEEDLEFIAKFHTPLDNGTLYHYISAGNWQDSTDARTLTWKETPFTDHKDFEIWYIFSVIPRTVEGFTYLLDGIEAEYEENRNNFLQQIEKFRAKDDQQSRKRIEGIETVLSQYHPAPFSDADRKNVADVVLEFYGIPTDNPEIADFIERQNWYPATTRPIEPALKAELLRRHNAGKTNDRHPKVAAAKEKQ